MLQVHRSITGERRYVEIEEYLNERAKPALPCRHAGIPASPPAEPDPPVYPEPPRSPDFPPDKMPPGIDDPPPDVVPVPVREPPTTPKPVARRLAESAAVKPAGRKRRVSRRNASRRGYRGLYGAET